MEVGRVTEELSPAGRVPWERQVLTFLRQNALLLGWGFIFRTSAESGLLPGFLRTYAAITRSCRRQQKAPALWGESTEADRGASSIEPAS